MVAPRTSHLKLNSISSCFKVTTMLCVHIWGVNPDVHTAELVNIFFVNVSSFFISITSINMIEKSIR